MDEVSVVHNPDKSRYELLVDGELHGLIDYVDRRGTFILTHTEVDPHLRNKGLGERLVHDTLADLRANDRAFVPTCPFIVAYVRRHPDEGSTAPST